ncbi:methyl-accepting chemotaxis protein [Rhodoplanes elegans]|uniref:methyl-accepting chemotaxis protein n=1 Tax=Rhodoplanes elegans TaxID=29408 RepID=UPI0019131FA3|nr:methyl-accepting chemotaxis protein [Rhodoplanes elegans]MBK5962479.1 methyl-accepting chemotaxis protein [Rhodoplanes elegans]
MSLLSKVRILPKILSVIALLGVAAVVISVISLNALSTLSDVARQAELAGEKNTLSSQLNINLLAMNRAEYRINAQPRPEIIQDATGRIERERKQFEERYELLKKLASTELDRRFLADFSPMAAAYFKELDATVSFVRGMSLPPSAETIEKLNREVVLSREAQEKARTRTREYFTELGKQVKELSAQGEQTAASGRNTIITVASVGILGALALGFFIGQFGIARPIGASVASLQTLAKDDFSIEIAGSDRGDEVGDIAKAALVFKQNGLDKQRMQREQKEAEQRAIADRKADMQKMANNFEAAVGEIINTVSSASTELEAAAGTLTRTAETTQGLATRVASASEQASTNVQSVASATNEMSSSVHEISRQVQESSRIANDAVKQAEKTDARITELSQAASRIGDVVKLITAIAEQTNLLALNATIEAARAGEAGKGFAVVANEVKALAAQTGKATGEISSQITSMQAATQDSVGAIKEIGGTIGRIAEITATIAAAVEEQGAATSEIARNVQQAASGTTEVATNIGEVDRGAAETGSASSQVLSSAQQLSGESNRLKLEVGKFLNTIRAA